MQRLLSESLSTSQSIKFLVVAFVSHNAKRNALLQKKTAETKETIAGQGYRAITEF